MTSPASRLPARPSLEQLRKQAKNLLRQYRAADPAAVQRVTAVIPRPIQPASGFALADAQFVLAREYGFQSWSALARHIEHVNPSESRPSHRPPIRPIELTSGRLITLADGGTAPADAVWSMFLAAHAGDLEHVKSLVARHPGLARHEYNYTPPIHFAVREGHASLVRYLIEQGASASYQSYPFQESLLTFAQDRGHDAVSAVIREHLSTRFALGDRIGGILEAAQRGDVTGVATELQRDPSLAQASNDRGMTALHAASNNGHLSVVQALLAVGAPVDAVMADGYRPIHCALLPRGRVRPAKEASAAVADALLAHGARYTVVVALLRGDRAFAKAAIARDPSLASAEDSCHRRPISIAADRDDLEMVELLLRAGADPNLSEEGAPRGQALWTAVYRRHREMARVLVEHGADPNAMVESSGTPILHARKDPDLLALLVAHGGRERTGDRERLEQLINDGDVAGVDRWLDARPTLIDDGAAFWSEGILAGPANAGNHAMIELLLRRGARVPTVSKWGRFYYFKHTDTAALLLDRGMDPDHMNWHYTSLLHHVATDGDLAQARLLLNHGAHIDAIDEEYRSTALGMAARWGQAEMVALLLERGADPSVAGDPWALPKSWARAKEHREIEAQLDGAAP